MIPMRDGVKLHAVILRPAGGGEALPFLMERTPYGVDRYTSTSVIEGKPDLARSGYIFVYEDIRGRYGSEGQFVMNRPIVVHTAKTDIDETTDTHDTVDWLLKNVPNNTGKVGVLGVSYPGFLAMMAGIDADPAVKCVSPQAPMTDIWLGDDFFHNGAFRETYGFDYVQQLEAQKTDVRVDSKEDTYDFFLRNVDFAGAAKTAGMQDLPTAKRFLNEPAYTKFWHDMGVEYHLGRVDVPTLEVGGYWDQEDMWGTQEEYAALHPHDTKHEVSMVLGPWNHGGWSFGPGDRLGGTFGTIDFGGAKTAQEYRTKFEAPFFDFYLKGKAGFDLKGVASFRHGQQRVGAVCRVAPGERVQTDPAMAPGGWPASCSIQGERRDSRRRWSVHSGYLCCRPGKPGALSQPADSGDVWERVEVADLAGRGPTLRRGAQRSCGVQNPGARARTRP